MTKAVAHYPAATRPERPLCSVCIANFNGEGMLVECIESVFAQTGVGEVEIIVHDDASTDGSVKLLRQRYPGIELLASHDNVGFCVANNRMVAHARGTYVLLLNNDAALQAGALSALSQAASSIGKPAILTLPQFDWQTGALVDRGCLLDPFCNPIPNLDAEREDVAYVIGACLWCPRATWVELGGFPEWMGSIGEDLYLCGLARLRGLPIRALRQSGYRHRQGASFGGNRAISGLQTTVRRRALSERNKTRAMMVLVPGVWMWALLGLHMCALLLEGLLLALWRMRPELLGKIYIPALAVPFREFARLRSRRAEAQALRIGRPSEWFRVVRWLPRKLALLLRYGLPTLR